MQFNDPIICLSNYGQVRSVTMAKILEDKGYKTLAAGMINNPPYLLNKIMEVAGTIVVCNKSNIERKFIEDTNKEVANNIFDLLNKHNEKIIVCDTVGFDRWGTPMHPELVERCNLFLDCLGNKSLDKEKILDDIQYRYYSR